MKSDNLHTQAHSIELLAPAKNLECGLAAIDHGADAVYIGAPRFSARVAAGNSLEDIARLVEYAHLFRTRVYVAVNTLLHEEELKEAEDLAWELYRIGVDALIVQDMGVTRLHLPPVPLHASTQTDNRTVEKVQFLSEAGFRQVVLARELSVSEIRRIHSMCPDTRLEVFVHGALCVSYSGQCYASQACYGRSANRGECAQFCRLGFDLQDATGKAIVRDRHLLSLKDLNRSGSLEELLDAGVSSLKIEGRLKDMPYVKNITAYYRRKLDAVLERRKEYVRSSSGSVKILFRPQPDKSFNRGFTEYFLHGRTSGVCSVHTPKSLGEEMGRVKEVYATHLTVEGIKPFANGDGLCYLDTRGRLHGFRVNKVEGNRLYPQEMPRIRPHSILYRNFDQEFERMLRKKSAERKIAVILSLRENNFGFTLTLDDEDGLSVSVVLERAKEAARTPQKENLRMQLGKLGNTPFVAERIDIACTGNWFIPSSELADLRRRGTERLVQARRITYPQEYKRFPRTTHDYPENTLSYRGNVMNTAAEAFYHMHGVSRIEPAFEKEKPERNAVLMCCKHCIRYSMGWCSVYQKASSPYREPYYLVSGDGRRFRLEFDCKSCQMKVYAEK